MSGPSIGNPESSDIQARQPTLEAALRENSRLQQRVVELENDLAHAKEAVLTVQGSTSWRVTRPLRALGEARLRRRQNSTGAETTGKSDADV